MSKALSYLKSLLTFERFNTASRIHRDALEEQYQELPLYGPGPRDWDEKDQAHVFFKPENRRLAKDANIALALSLGLWAGLIVGAFVLLRIVLFS